MKANPYASLANLSHLLYTEAVAMSCVPHGLRPALPERTCGAGLILRCKIRKKRRNKEHETVLWFVKWNADKGRGGEKQEELMGCLFGDESQQIRSSLFRPLLELCII